jgi:hypothetical protein
MNQPQLRDKVLNWALLGAQLKEITANTRLCPSPIYRHKPFSGMILWYVRRADLSEEWRHGPVGTWRAFFLMIQISQVELFCRGERVDSLNVNFVHPPSDVHC